jgi:hypothetical protein
MADKSSVQDRRGKGGRRVGSSKQRTDLEDGVKEVLLAQCCPLLRLSYVLSSRQRGTDYAGRGGSGGGHVVGSGSEDVRMIPSLEAGQPQMRPTSHRRTVLVAMEACIPSRHWIGEGVAAGVGGGV